MPPVVPPVKLPARPSSASADRPVSASGLTYRDSLLHAHAQPIDDEFQAIEDFLSDENLREAAGGEGTDLTKVRRIELKVDTTEMSLGSLGVRMPSLTELKLNSSILPSVRDLGTGFKNLSVLWLSRCGLRDLEGIGSVPSLSELYAAFNDIQELSPLNACDGIEVLDLEGNIVSDTEEVAFLSNCTTLNSLSLEGNPVSQQPGYRQSVAVLLPALSMLDDMDISDADRHASPDKADALTVLGTPEPELDMVHMGIKYARCGIDDVSFSIFSDEEEALARTGEIDRVVYTGPGSITARVRPQSARLHRPSSATARPESGYVTARARPMTASMSRPSSSRGLGASGLSLASTSDQTASLASTRRHAVEDDTSSDLTFGMAESFAGNPASALRSRQLSATAEGSKAVDFETEVLEQLCAWKRETAEIALAHDAGDIEMGASEAAERLVFDVAAGEGAVATPRLPIFYTEGKQSAIDMAMELAQRTEYRPRTADTVRLHPAAEPSDRPKTPKRGSPPLDARPAPPADARCAPPAEAAGMLVSPTKLRRVRKASAELAPLLPASQLSAVDESRPKSAGRLRPKTPDRKASTELAPLVAAKVEGVDARPRSAGMLRPKTPDRARTPPAKENDINQVTLSPDDDVQRAGGAVITGRLRPKEVDRMKVVSMSTAV